MSAGAYEAVRAGLDGAARRLRAMGLPVPPLEGKLLRPMVAWACLDESRREDPGEAFWLGALAVQMVHEASLLHDDILDGAQTRRGRPSVAVDRGVAAALIGGDRLLTSAYRAAAATGSTAFLHLFVEAVERTVAGEEAQGRSIGRRLSVDAYRSMIRGKSGELFGCVAALPRALDCGDDPDDDRLAQAREVGLRLGAVYQMVDDLLDCCPAASSGKPRLQDFAQGKWTWVAQEAGLSSLELSDAELLDAVFRAGSGPSAARRCLARLEREGSRILDEPAAPGGLLAELVDAWVRAARAGVSCQERAMKIAPSPGGVRSGSRESPGAAREAEPELRAHLIRRAAALGGPSAWPAYFGRQSRSFRFAAWLFPARVRGRVAAVYAFCRFTDDLVDEASPAAAESVLRRVEVWRSLAREAYRGTPTGAPLLDDVMGDMAGAGVPFDYVTGLLDGVAQDAGRVRIASLAELEAYTWRVASVVGGWITELMGIHDPAILQRAFHLGHAMQVTNILRDVGEDWRRDRLYLPATLMARHGVDEAMVDALARGAVPVPGAWVALLEDLMKIADDHYDSAFEALPLLPPFFRRPVAVAARVYQGIHDEIRGNGYDNGTRRAFTGGARKVTLAVRALLELRKSRAPAAGAPALPALTLPADG